MPTPDATTTDPALLDIDGAIATITLNRPAAFNAIDLSIAKKLERLGAEVERNNEVRVLVIEGAGRAFCAGGDVQVQADAAARGGDRTPEQRADDLLASMEASRLLHEMPKPTIAMLNGVAAGAGFSLALACDLRVAGESARLTTAFAKVGLSGDYGGTWFLTRLVGPARARELYFTSDVLDAGQIVALGLANRVVPDLALEAETMALASKLANGPAIALRYIKRNLNVAITGDLSQSFESEAFGMLRCRQSEDHREASRAFVEKRGAVFKGR
jgi:2-(1,2-epoxy-1,2-dihydrophenyl)acetyl-CoA isomerase